MANTLRELIEDGIVSPALLPEDNDYILSEEGKAKRDEVLEKGLSVINEDFHNLSFNEKSKYLNLSALDSLDGYLVTLIAHDYAGKTPVMWNTVYKQKGINLRNMMVIGDKEDTNEILEVFRKDPKYLGGGAGVGFKESVMKYLDRLDPEDVKSVNIIVKRDGELVGYNTDSEGLMRSIEDRLNEFNGNVKGNKVITIGAGGVNQQFVRTLIERGVGHVVVANRTYEKAEALANNLNSLYGRNVVGPAREDEMTKLVSESDVPVVAIVNTSDKGGDSFPDVSMYHSSGDDNEEISRKFLRNTKSIYPNLVYADIVLPSGGKSVSLRLASEEGIDEKYLLDGKPMVVYQAVPAYKMVESAFPDKHSFVVEDSELLSIFQKVAF